MSQAQIDRLRIVEDELWETRDWFESSDIGKARKRHSALSGKLHLIVQQAAHGGGDGEEIRQDIKEIRAERDELANWIKSQNTDRGGFYLKGMTRMRFRHQGPSAAENEEAHQS